MKRFFSNILTAFIGTFLALFALIFVLIGKFSAEVKTTPVAPNSFLKLNFNSPIPELTGNVNNNISLNDLTALTKKNIGLHEYIKAIDQAASDKNIKGIYLELDNHANGLATSKQLRNAILKFKESGKFVYAYANYYSKSGYYLATVADSVFVHPLGGVDFLGFSAIITFFKGSLDKLGVKAMPFYAGKFKSATEPFRMEQMSAENRTQTREYIEGMFSLYLNTISEGRNIDIATLRNIADNALADNATAALNLKLVDALKYKDEVIELLHNKTGISQKEKLNPISLDQYIERTKTLQPTTNSKNTIAIVYAEGNIVDGEGSLGSIGGDKYARIIREIRQKDNVKAIVLRINSGGGSSLASDIIWREIEKAKEQGIKIVTSMGNYAASGGYYIASNSDYIFAEENTLTGSIGVFGLLFNMNDLYKNKLGMTMDTVKTTSLSTLDAANYYGVNEREAALIQKSVDEVYEVFKKRVSDGRKMSMEAVEEIAQGRVWLGVKAKEIGLVDSLAGLQSAIAYAAQLANIDSYKTSNYPVIKDMSEEILNLFNGVDDHKKPEMNLPRVNVSDIFVRFPELHKMINTLEDIQQLEGVQTRLPFSIEIQ